LLSIVFASLRK